MAYSITGIANSALIKMGADTITAITDTGDEKARKLNAVWEYVRDEVLEEKEWNFAKKRAELAKSTSVPEFGYDYKYALPADYLRILSHNMSKNTEYVIEGGYLLTDYDNTSTGLFILYTAKIADPTKYTSNFITAVSYRWAAEVCERITGGTVKAQAMMQGYMMALQRADSLNQMTSGMVENEEGSDDWVKAGRSLVDEGQYVINS